MSADDYPRGEQGTCHVFHELLAMRFPELTVVHGTLHLRYRPTTPWISIDHTWCVDQDGQVIDRTSVIPEGVEARWEAAA